MALCFVGTFYSDNLIITASLSHKVNARRSVHNLLFNLIVTFIIEDNQGNIVTDHRKALRIWEKYIQNLYDSENRPKDIAIEAEDELDEDDKGPTILKSEVVKAIKDMRRQKATGDDNSRFTQGTGRQWIENNDCTG